MRIDWSTHAVAAGDGPAVVLVHGVGLDHTLWDAAVRSLRATHRVLRYDLLAHGLTRGGPRPLTLADFVGQLAALLDEHGAARATLVGFSMGAMIAQAFALEHPDRVDRLVLLSAVHARSAAERAAVRRRVARARRAGPDTLIGPALERWFSADFTRANPGAVNHVRDRLAANDGADFLAAYAVFAEADADLAPRLGALRAPTLVLTGEEDPGSTPAMAGRLARSIPGAELRILAGLRHLVPIEGAAVLDAELRAFLARRARA